MTSPTMRDVALHAGVSPMTVSRALRDDPRVSETTKARVLRAVTTLGYRRNEVARSLRLGGSHRLLGLIVTNLANPFYSQLALGVEAVASENGMRVILGNSGEDAQREGELAHDFAARRLDGIIAVPSGNHHGHLDPVNLGGVPVVLTASPGAKIGVDSVVLDDFGGTWAAVVKLIERGHTRLGFLGPAASTWTGSERYRGFCAALEEAGLPVQDRYVSRNNLDVASAEQAAAKLINQRNAPTALFAANNRNTIGAYRAIIEHHATVSLAGFDDFELADMLSLPLIVVRYDPRELGRKAAALLCQRIDDRQRSEATPPRQIIVATSVVEYGAASTV